MMTNMGERIKFWARVIMLLGTISSIILGLVLMVPTGGIGAAIIPVGVVLALFGGMILMGFGEIVGRCIIISENTSKIRKMIDAEITEKKKALAEAKENDAGC